MLPYNVGMIQFCVQQSLQGETCIVLVCYTAKSAYIVNTHWSQMRVRSACHLLWTLENAGNRFIFPEGRLGLSLDCFTYYVYLYIILLWQKPSISRPSHAPYLPRGVTCHGPTLASVAVQANLLCRALFVSLVAVKRNQDVAIPMGSWFILMCILSGTPCI